MWLTIVPISPAVVHPEFAVRSKDGEGVVNHSTELGVNVLRDVFSSAGSVPGPVDKVADYVLVTV